MGEPTLSDHAMIAMELRVEANPQFIRNPRNTNWENVTQELEGTLIGFPKTIRSISTLEDAAHTLTAKLPDAFENNCPLKKVKSKGHTLW